MRFYKRLRLLNAKSCKLNHGAIKLIPFSKILPIKLIFLNNFISVGNRMIGYVLLQQIKSAYFATSKIK